MRDRTCLKPATCTCVGFVCMHMHAWGTCGFGDLSSLLLSEVLRVAGGCGEQALTDPSKAWGLACAVESLFTGGGETGGIATRRARSSLQES